MLASFEFGALDRIWFDSGFISGCEPAFKSSCGALLRLPNVNSVGLWGVCLWEVCASEWSANLCLRISGPAWAERQQRWGTEPGIPATGEGFWCLTLTCHGTVAPENWLFGCLQGRACCLGLLLSAPLGFLLLCIFLPLTHFPLFFLWSPPAICFLPQGRLLFYPSLVHGGETSDFFWAISIILFLTGGARGNIRAGYVSRTGLAVQLGVLLLFWSESVNVSSEML